jgi:hypothetical protein
MGEIGAVGTQDSSGGVGWSASYRHPLAQKP